MNRQTINRKIDIQTDAYIVKCIDKQIDILTSDKFT